MSVCLYSIYTSINLHCAYFLLPVSRSPLLFFPPLCYSVFWLHFPIFITLLYLSLACCFSQIPPLIYPSLLLLSLSPSLFSLPLQCIRHIATLLLQNQPNLQQPALKLMAESGDEELLQLTLDQINSMTAVSVIVAVLWHIFKWRPSGPESLNQGSCLCYIVYICSDTSVLVFLLEWRRWMN